VSCSMRVESTKLVNARKCGDQETVEVQGCPRSHGSSRGRRPSTRFPATSYALSHSNYLSQTRVVLTEGSGAGRNITVTGHQRAAPQPFAPK